MNPNERKENNIRKFYPCKRHGYNHKGFWDIKGVPRAFLNGYLFCERGRILDKGDIEE